MGLSWSLHAWALRAWAGVTAVTSDERQQPKRAGRPRGSRDANPAKPRRLHPPPNRRDIDSCQSPYACPQLHPIQLWPSPGMAIFGRLRCHFCGVRSRFSTGTTEFQCTACEANNFYDVHGNVADVPAEILQRSLAQPALPKAFARPAGEELLHQKAQPFCDTCVKNQTIYLESISQYFPDDDDARYAEYEAKFPAYKADLERRYPQVCRRCAPQAQTKIHNADVYSQKQMFGLNVKLSEERRRQGKTMKGLRDTPVKRLMRLLLDTIQLLAFASLCIQLLWHSLALLSTIGVRLPTADPTQPGALHPDSTVRDCMRDAMSLRFTSGCFFAFSHRVGISLVARAAVFWYNPALKFHWHDTYLIDYTRGKAQYYRVQALMFLVRLAAWHFLSQPVVVDGLTTQRTLAIHGGTLAFLLLAERLSSRKISFHKKRVNTKITPLPDERDILGTFAGPEKENSISKASSVKPLRLFQREEGPFPIASLASGSQGRKGPRPFGHPSPPASESVSSDEDAMDIDWRQSATGPSLHAAQSRTRQANQRSIYNHSDTQPLGWSAMRAEAFSIEDNLRAEEQRKRREAENKQKTQLRYDPRTNNNPFRGTLPPAPMSMERRLRNPPAQFEFKRADPTAKADFMSKMREGLEDARTFRQQQSTRARKTQAFDPDLDGSQYDPDETESVSTTPKATPRRRDPHDMIRPGQWVLQKDLDDQWTGLEDMFGGETFRIADEPAGLGAMRPAAQRSGTARNRRLVLIACGVAVFAAVWTYRPFRRTLALYLVRKLEEYGH